MEMGEEKKRGKGSVKYFFKNIPTKFFHFPLLPPLELRVALQQREREVPVIQIGNVYIATLPNNTIFLYTCPKL